MPAQEQSLWTEEQGETIEALRRYIQRVKQEHEAALEEHKQALLQCQHEIQFLRESTIALQQIIVRLSQTSSISLSATSSSGSSSKTTAIGSIPSHTSNT